MTSLISRAGLFSLLCRGMRQIDPAQSGRQELCFAQVRTRLRVPAACPCDVKRRYKLLVSFVTNICY